MSSVSNVTARINEIYRYNEIKKTDIRLEQQRVDERRIKYQKEVEEQKRIEINRRMNRPGQNVDRMA